MSFSRCRHVAVFQELRCYFQSVAVALVSHELICDFQDVSVLLFFENIDVVFKELLLFFKNIDVVFKVLPWCCFSRT
jgi:hypothetical protein